MGIQLWAVPLVYCFKVKGHQSFAAFPALIPTTGVQLAVAAFAVAALVDVEVFDAADELVVVLDPPMAAEPPTAVLATGLIVH